MGTDLFENEQMVYDAAMLRAEAVRGGGAFDAGEYAALAEEYGRLLKQLRRGTHLADMTSADLYESNLNLTDKVHYDELTGIFNRRYLQENLKRVIKSMRRANREQLSVLMMDIDYFKKYNDAYGHGEGDACLKAVAKAIKESVMRAEDFAVRYGGEEFAAILPGTNENGAREVAERILHNVRALNIPHEQSDVAGCVTISIGGTTGNVLRSWDGDGYLKKADEALYKSKQGGRDRYTYLSFEEESV